MWLHDIIARRLFQDTLSGCWPLSLTFCLIKEHLLTVLLEATAMDVAQTATDSLHCLISSILCLVDIFWLVYFNYLLHKKDGPL